MRTALFLAGILLACAPPPRSRPAPAPRPGPAPPAKRATATRPPPAPARHPDAGEAPYTGPGSCVARGLGTVEDLALDAGQLYVTAGNRVLLLTTGGAPQVLADRQPDPHDLVLDESRLYWLAHEEVRAVNRSGGTVETLASPPAARSYFEDLVRLGPRLVWTAPATKQIWGVAREGGRLQMVAFTAGHRDCTSLAVIGEELFAGCADAVIRVLQNRAAHVRLATPARPVRRLTADRGQLVWAEGERIMTMKPVRTARPVALATGAGRVGDLALDGGSVYWTDLKRRTLLGLPPRGGKPRVILSDPGLAGPLVVGQGQVYWSRTGSVCSVARLGLP